MNDWPDMRLLREYAEHGTEEAFTELVARHLPMVYQAAQRQTQQVQLAEEVVQTVFALLARKARRISAQTLLSGWLFNTARFVSTRAVRDEIRRRRRESEAARMNPDASSPEPAASEQRVFPLLDGLLARLSSSDRQAVLARYFEGKSFKQVGLAIGTSEEAAKKRVQRALEKLREKFRARGVAISAAALATTLEGTQTQALPVGLSASAVSSAAIKAASGAVALSSLTQTALEIMSWTRIKLTAAALVAVALGVGTLTYFRDHAVAAASPSQSAAQESATLLQRANELQVENARLTTALSAARAQRARLLEAKQRAERSTRLYKEIAEQANPQDPTNAFPTVRHLFAGLGGFLRRELDLASLPESAKTNQEGAILQQAVGLAQVAVRNGWDDYKASSADEAADLGACLLHGLLDLQEQQFAGVNELLLSQQQERARPRPEQQRSFDILDSILATNCVDGIRNLLTPTQVEVFGRLLEQMQTGTISLPTSKTKQ